MKQRIDFIDLAKGICISLVVLLHVYGDLSGALIKVMNLFRMPLYFFLSGLFFKTYDGFVPFVKKKTNKLLIPFILTFVIIIIPTTLFLEIKGGHTIIMKNIIWALDGKMNLGIDGASWFLLCLFFVNLLFYIVFLMTNRNIIGVSILSCVCGILGYTLGCMGFWLPLWIDSSFTAMPFFLMGYLMRNYGNLLYGRYSRKDSLSFAFFLLILLIVYWYDESRSTGIIAFGENVYDINIVSLYLGGFSGTYCVILFSKRVNKVPILSYIGRYSIVVLLTHLLYLFAIRNTLYQLDIPQNNIWINLFVFLIIMILSVPTIKFCITYLPYWFAQKDLIK